MKLIINKKSHVLLHHLMFNLSFDDIVIGSPLYRKNREKFDIGRIDVYIRDKRYPNEYKFLEQKIDGFDIKSRFGHTVAKLGDVNNDGFNGN